MHSNGQQTAGQLIGQQFETVLPFLPSPAFFSIVLGPGCSDRNASPSVISLRTGRHFHVLARSQRGRVRCIRRTPRHEVAAGLQAEQDNAASRVKRRGRTAQPTEKMRSRRDVCPTP